MKGIIITEIHHDGFCLWPFQFMQYSKKKIIWKDGKGGVLSELIQAWDEYGL